MYKGKQTVIKYAYLNNKTTAILGMKDNGQSFVIAMEVNLPYPSSVKYYNDRS